jgi:segregation and condensation protein B
MSSLAEELTHTEEEVVDADARPEELRLLEALLFAAGEPLDEKTLAARLPSGTDVRAALRRLQTEYAPRGVNLVRVGNKWTFRTSNDLAWLLTHEAIQPKKLSRAALETLAIVAYRQPLTRAGVEAIRGVNCEAVLESLERRGLVAEVGRQDSPGHPRLFGTTLRFLEVVGLERVEDLPPLPEGTVIPELPAERWEEAAVPVSEEAAT